MLKRFVALFLAMAMAVGMLPMGIRVSAQESGGTKIIHAACAEVTPDGVLNEAWTPVGKLGTARFGALYAAGYLYLGFDAALTELSVKLGGETAAVEL